MKSSSEFAEQKIPSLPYDSLSIKDIGKGLRLPPTYLFGNNNYNKRSDFYEVVVNLKQAYLFISKNGCPIAKTTKEENIPIS